MNKLVSMTLEAVSSNLKTPNTTFFGANNNDVMTGHSRKIVRGRLSNILSEKPNRITYRSVE